MMTWLEKIAAFAFLGFCLSGNPCVADPPKAGLQPATLVRGDTDASGLRIEVVARQTCEGIGACQGASLHDGFVYLYGDLYQKDRQSGPGVIRQYAIRRNENGVPSLADTGLEIQLTRNGENIVNHPTGLTWNPTYGAYLGNTVTKTKKGTIYHLNWSQMLIDRNLDNAVLNIIDDDLAIQGCRPEFVRHGERWLLATADYGQLKNSVRFYDPALLAKAKATSDPSILTREISCTPWVQQLHWIDAPGRLILVQNQIEGRRWRLTLGRPWSSDPMSDFSSTPPYDEITDDTELEGFTMLDREYCLLVSSSRYENATVARIVFVDRN